jgi:hypothetical protein
MIWYCVKYHLIGGQSFTGKMKFGTATNGDWKGEIYVGVGDIEM